MINYFLIIFALVYLIYASVSDIKKREVPNWLSFSLIGFALSYRLFFSVLNSDFMFFAYGLLGLVIFVGLGYLFYYSRIFAGGDAKLLMALGAVLPVSDFYSSVFLSAGFVFLLLLSGSLYGMAWSFVIAVKNKEKFSSEFIKQFRKKKNVLYFSFIAAAAVFIFILLIKQYFLVLLSLIFVIFPFLYAYAKSIEEFMIASVPARELTEGDWLYQKVKVGKRVIKPYWEGLSSEELTILKKKKGKVRIKQGIPFVPAFLFAFLALVYLAYSGFDILNLFF